MIFFNMNIPMDTIKTIMLFLEFFFKIGCVFTTLTTFFLKIYRTNSFKKKIYSIDPRLAEFSGVKHFIHTKGQDDNPCDNEDGNLKAASNSYDLIKKFIRKEFSESSHNKYYIVLADSGMGKTTFLLNLMKKYYRKLFRRFNIEFVYLADPQMLEKIIKQTKKPSKTILLLDGFDEDPCAQNNEKTRITEICEKTKYFFKVVITCRIQFFSKEIEEPLYTNVVTSVGTTKYEKFKRFYLSHFNDKDVRYFLFKKYPFNRQKRIATNKIIEKCSQLGVRPLLLSYIVELNDGKKEYNYSYEIYEQLIKEWIQRETGGERELEKSLNDFLTALTLGFFETGTINVSSEKIKELEKKLENILPHLVKHSRSLLNRDSCGRFKFAHRSIMEYFLAVNAFDDLALRKKGEWFRRYEMTQLFLFEMCHDTCRNHKTDGGNIDLSHMPIGHISNLRNFSNMILKGINFSYSDLSCVDFSSSDLSYCNFEKSILNMALLNNAKLKNALLSFANFNSVTCKNCEFNGAVCKSTSFYEADLARSIFVSANLENASFCHAELRGCNMKYALLTHANFNNAHVAQTDFRNTDVSSIKCDKKYFLLTAIFDEEVDL